MRRSVTVTLRLVFSLATAAIAWLFVVDYGPRRTVPCTPGGDLGRGGIDIRCTAPVIPLAVAVLIGVAAGYLVWRLSRPRQ